MAYTVQAVGPDGQRAAENVRRLRQNAKLSLQVLSERLSELGRPIDFSKLGKLEKGQRRIDVDDLIALAAALEVGVPQILGVPEADTPRVTRRISAAEARRRLEAIALIATDGVQFEVVEGK